jgi:hypothetical protein
MPFAKIATNVMQICEADNCVGFVGGIGGFANVLLAAGTGKLVTT